MNGLAALQRFARSKPVGERCDLCAREVGEEHDHLIEAGGVRCACRACAMLFEGKRVPPKIERVVPAIALPDIPVSLAWIVRLADGSTVVRYPSPAGIAQSAAPAPDVELAPEIEAILVRGEDCFRVSIDHCYALAGVLRARGDVDAWFARLASRA